MARSVFPGFGDLADDRPPVIRALVTLRRAEGLSQAEVARLMGTSQPAVARLESGTGDVRLSTLARYAEATRALTRPPASSASVRVAFR